MGLETWIRFLLGGMSELKYKGQSYMQRPTKSRAWEAMTSVLKKGPDGSESKVFIEQTQGLNSVPKTYV